MAWDPGVGAAVLFGGRTGESPLETDNDTWLFEGAAWTEWVGPSSPGPAWQAGAAQDPTTGLLVLVGGGNCSSSDCPSTSPWGFGPQHAVSGSTGTGTCANLSLAGTPLLPGRAAELQNGTYPFRIATCSGFQLANVTTTALLFANATAENVTAWTGAVLVHGVGTIFVNLTHPASSPPPSGLAAISVLGLTFLELLLIFVALAAVFGVFLAIRRVSRRPDRPPANTVPAGKAEDAAAASAPSGPAGPKT
jgi:hypothetical protein